MTKASRDKGVRRERMIVNKHRDLNIPCARISAPYKKGADLLIGAIPDRASLVAEVKGRADGSGFKTITKWMGEPPVVCDCDVCIGSRAKRRRFLAVDDTSTARKKRDASSRVVIDIS